MCLLLCRIRRGHSPTWWCFYVPWARATCFQIPVSHDGRWGIPNCSSSSRGRIPNCSSSSNVSHGRGSRGWFFVRAYSQREKRSNQKPMPRVFFHRWPPTRIIWSCHFAYLCIAQQTHHEHSHLRWGHHECLWLETLFESGLLPCTYPPLVSFQTTKTTTCRGFF